MSAITLTTGGTYTVSIVNGLPVFLFSGIIEEDINLENVHFSNDYNLWTNAAAANDGGPLQYDDGSHSIFSSNSTRKVKKNISPLSDHISIDSMLKLEGRSYKWNRDDSLDMGFIADEAAAANPLFANENISDINTRAILAAVVELIKDLDSRIELINKKKK